MPAIVTGTNGEDYEVVTTDDIRKSQRFWIGIFGVALIGLASSGLVWGANTNNSIDRNRIGHVSDSSRITKLENVQNTVSDQLRHVNRVADGMARKLGVQVDP